VRAAGALRKGEFFLDWADKGSAKANWKENFSQLRNAMSTRSPIRDTHLDPKTGELIQADKGSFLGAERNALQNKGWTYSPKTQTWNAPKEVTLGSRIPGAGIGSQ
jgi:hypothetical protein